MILTDTHTHLYSESFNEDRNAMVQRALDNNITRFFIPAIDSTYTKAMYSLEKDFPNHVHLMMGLHPTHVKKNFKEELAHVTQQFDERDFIAVGEIGIDLYWEKKYLKQQQEAFNYQILLAKEKDLPIVIHCRDADDDILYGIKKNSSTLGVIHCFASTLDFAKKILESVSWDHM